MNWKSNSYDSYTRNVRVNSFNLISRDNGDLESLACSPDVRNVENLQYIYVDTQPNNYVDPV